MRTLSATGAPAMPRTLACLALCLLPLLAASPSSRAAESFGNCAGYIDTLPSTLSTQGTWCLRKDLATAIGSGRAITIAANNITVDCNGFKIGGLLAGAGTQAVGIGGVDRLNIIVRRCNVRGFRTGIGLEGSGGGHLVEDNRLDNNTGNGIVVLGDSGRVRRNWVRDTGGGTSPQETFGIAVEDGEVTDNIVSGVLPLPGPGGAAFGIFSGSGLVDDNLVRLPDASTVVVGIYAACLGACSARRNDVVGPGGTGSTGVYCAASTVLHENIIGGFETAFSAGTCASTNNEVIP